MRHTLYYNKTRLAPTPSGYLHLGNVYSFLYTTAFAHHTGAKVLLRIDDLDKDRSRPQYIQDIFDTLEFMGIPWDEGPRNAAEFEKEYSQNHRLGLYTEALNKLKSDGLLYACNCSRSQLSELGEYAGTCRDKNLSFDAPGVNWRLRTPASMSIKVKDPEGRMYARKMGILPII
jgi:glutamyl/glutaminyl-tRNA synthetase